MKTLKKVLVYTVVFTTVLALANVVAFAPTGSFAASAGQRIKGPSTPDTYYLGSDMKRYVFASGMNGVYGTWFDSYSGITTVSQSELEGYSLGGNVCVRPGTALVKIMTDPKTYAVEKGCILRHVPSEAVANSLYGSMWYTKVMTVPDYLFVNYTVGSPISSAMYPSGTLVKDGSGTVYVIDGTAKRPFASEAAFTANGYQWKHVVSATDLSAYSAGSSVTGYEPALGTVAGPGVTPSVTGGSLSVFLAPDSPVSATVVNNAQRVYFTKVGFTASSSGAASVDWMTVRRTGLALDASFSDVILVDAQTGNQVGNEKSLGSTHEVTFNDDLEIPAGMTKYYYLAANMSSSVSAGEMPRLALTAVGLKGGATLSGSLPIEGNAMSTNASVTIGTVTSAAGGLAPSAQSKEVGTMDYIFTSERLSVNGTEDVNVESIRFYQNGTAADSDLKDLELVVDGAVIAGPSQVTNKEVIFNLVNPLKIAKGTNKEFSLRGDIVNGSSRTISFVHEKKTDVRVKGLTYGFYLNPTYPNSSNPYFDPSDTTTISTGSLTVSKAVTSSSNVAEGKTQEEVGAFYLQSQGEETQVSRLSINFVVSGTGNAQDLTNVTVYGPTGAVVAGPVDPSSTGQTATTTDTFIVPVGINKYVIKADLNTDFAVNDTIQARIQLPGTYITAKGLATNNTITPTPSTTVSLDTVTVKVGSLLVRTSTSPAAQTVIAGTSNFTFANFVLDASQSGEDVRVTQLAVRHYASASSIHNVITNITLYDGATALNTPEVGGESASSQNATSTLTMLTPLTVAKGTTKTLTLKGNVSGSAGNSTTHAFSLVSSSAATATGATTANSITPSTTNSDGQTMTIATAGTLTLFAAGANPVSGYLTANSTGNTAMVFSAKADYEDVEVQDIAFTFADVNGSNTQNNIDTMYLYDGSTLVGSVPVVGSIATVSPSSLTIPANSTKNLTVKLDTREVGPNKAGVSGNTFTFSIAATGNYVVKGKSSGSTSVTKSGTPASNQMTVAKTVPSITKGSVSSTLTNGGAVAIGRFAVSANAKGDLGFYKAEFSLTTTTATITNIKIYEDPDTSAVDLTANGARGLSEVITSASGNPLSGGVYNFAVLFDTDTSGANSGVGSGGEYRTIPAGGSRTYEIRGDVTGVTTGSTVVVQLLGDNAFPSSYPMRATTIDSASSDNFIWSDLNFGNNSTTATKTDEWFNGYRILATTTLQVLSK